MERQPQPINVSTVQARAPHTILSARSLLSVTFLLLILSSLLLNAPMSLAEEADFDFFSDEPIAEEELIVVPPPPPLWKSVGAPLALVGFFVVMAWVIYRCIPFRQVSLNFNLHDLPIAAQRGIGMAVMLYGIAFLFGFFTGHYQMNIHGSAHAFFDQMGIGKMIAFTHAHLFGFTTSFVLIGIPFSLHFSRLVVYQWIFPLGLMASLTDVIAWWGLKYISPNFEYVLWGCGFIFSICYLWMLIGLVRVLFFPKFKWFSDFISEDHQRRWEEENKKSKKSEK